MADDILHPTMQERAEIDTSLPFQSVKAAVSMFGERVNGKRIQPVEKQSLKNSEVLQLKEELAAMKHRLAAAEEAKAKACEELRDTRKFLSEFRYSSGDPFTAKQVETCNASSDVRMVDIDPNICGSKLEDPCSGDGADHDESNKDVSKHGNLKAEEKHVVWEVELKVAQEQHMNAVAELESVKTDLERLKEELVASLQEKESALRQAEEALMAAELNAKRVEELSHEMSGTNESLVLVKMACIEASKERAVLLAAKDGTSTHVSHTSEHSMLIVEELETKLALAEKELLRLQQELATAKEAEVRVALAASEAYAKLAQMKLELEKSHMQTCIGDGAPCPHSPERKTRNHELEKALETGASLQATLESLQRELETMQKELGDLRDREATASAAVVTLSMELARTKEDLSSALAAETKANEAVTALTQTLQQIKLEADEARANAEILMAEATKARVDAEFAKSALANAEQEMKVAMEAAEMAKAAEREALERFKVLSEKMNEVRSLRAEGGTACISISEDEYEQLKKKVNEAEELASMRIAAANVQVEAVKLSEMQLQQKMKALSSDIDIMRSNTEQALQKAEMAEAAKRVVESEMRRWRESGKGSQRELNGRKEADQAEKETESPSMHRVYGIKSVEDMTSQLVVVGSKSQSLTYSSAPPESLAQILNMRMPSLASEARTLSNRSLGQKKKKHYILPNLSIFSTKKSQPLTSSSMVET